MAFIMCRVVKFTKWLRSHPGAPGEVYYEIEDKE